MKSPVQERGPGQRAGSGEFGADAALSLRGWNPCKRKCVVLQVHGKSAAFKGFVIPATWRAGARPNAEGGAKGERREGASQAGIHVAVSKWIPAFAGMTAEAIDAETL